MLLMALSTSCSLISPIFTSSRSYLVSFSKSSRDVGLDRLSTSLKSSIHFWLCSSDVVSITPFLSFTGIDGWQPLPVNSFTILYRVLFSSLLAASCASYPFLWNHSCFSPLQLCFTTLSVTLYCWVSYAFFSTLSTSCSSFWIFLLSLINFHILSCIHIFDLFPLLLPNCSSVTPTTTSLNNAHCSSKTPAWWSAISCYPTAVGNVSPFLGLRIFPQQGFHNCLLLNPLKLEFDLSSDQVVMWSHIRTHSHHLVVIYISYWYRCNRSNFLVFHPAITRSAT